MSISLSPDAPPEPRRSSRLLDVRQVVEQYGIHERGVRWLITTRRVETVKIGTRVYVTRKSLDRLIAEGTTRPDGDVR